MLLCAIFCQMVPFQFFLSTSSLQCLAGPPRDYFRFVRFPCDMHRSSCILLTCPGQVHFYLLTQIYDLCLFSYPDVCFMSRYVLFSILLSIFVGAVASLFFARMVRAHVLAPYIIAGSVYEL